MRDVCATFARSPPARVRVRVRVRVRAYEMSNGELHTDAGPGQGDAMFRQIGIKMWADGSPWIGNIATSFPYLSNDRTAALGLGPGHRGCANYTPGTGPRDRRGVPAPRLAAGVPPPR